MSDKALEILDHSVAYSLWVLIAVCLSGVAYALVRRRAGVFVDWPRLMARAAGVSVLLAVVSFLLFAFVPLPFLENFANVRSLESRPLRLTALTYERFYEGFSLHGEVWNQAHEPVQRLQAVIKIWSTDQKILDTIYVPVAPQPLPPGASGVFSMNYSQNSPFLYAYEVQFIAEQGVQMPYVKGFDVQ